MSNQIQIPYYDINNTIYVTIRDDSSKVWNTVTKLFEVWSDLNIANYVIEVTYKEGSLHTVSFPSDIDNGNYTAMIFIQGGLIPAVAADIWIGDNTYTWDKANASLTPVGGSSEDGSVVTIERSPKVQVKRSENVTITTVPAEVTIDPETISRTSEANTNQIQRGSSSRIGP